MQELLHWAESQGARTQKLCLSADDSRAFVAAEDIAQGDAIVSLPQRLLLHADIAYQDDEYGDAFRHLREELGPDMDQRHILCLLLILERARGPASRWADYLNILPTAYDDPFWWTDQEVQLLAGTRLIKAIQQYRPGLDQLTSWVKRLQEHRSRSGGAAAAAGCVLTDHQEGWALTAQAACWARSTVWSRAFTVHQLCDRSSVVALVPVLDMIDHSPEVEAVWHTGQDGKEDFQFATLTPVKKGALISNNYGNKTNDELLLAYGFVVPDNPANFFQVSLARGAQPHPQLQQQLPNGVAGAAAAAAAAAPHALGRNGLNGSSEGARGFQPFRPPPEASSEEEAGGDMQQCCEELQRDVVMALMGLEQQHRLTAQQPLPAQLLHCAQVGLMPPAALYQLCARLLKLVQEQQQKGAQVIGGPAAASLASQPQPGSDAAAAATASTQIVLNAKAPPWTANALPGSAMHVVPHHKQAPGQDRTEAQANAQATAPAAHLAGALLDGAGMGHSRSGPGSSPSAVAWQALAPSAQRLPALVAVQQQMESKLQAMVSEHRARQLLSVPEDAPRLLPDGATALESQGPSPFGPYGPRPDWLTQHAALALAYVRDQHHVLQASLQQLRERVSHAVTGLARHAHPAPQLMAAVHSGSSLRGVAAFEFHQPALAHEMAPPQAPRSASSAQQQPAASTSATPHPFSTTPAILDASGTQHMDGFMQWLSSSLSAEDCRSGTPASNSGEPSSSGRQAIGLCEVTCRARREALSAAAAASRAAAAASASGSRGRRKPLASLTLRSLRNISASGMSASRLGSGSASGASGGAAQPTNTGPAAQLQPRISEDELSPQPQQPVPSLPAGIAASLGLDLQLAYDSVSWGATTTAAHAPGDILLEVPCEYALVASSKAELLAALMLPAHDLLQELVAHAAAVGGVDGAVAVAASSSRTLPPRDILVLHLMHMVGASPASRLPASENHKVSMLMEMLEDSPVGTECQGAYDLLKSDFQQLTALVAAVSQSQHAASRHKVMRKVLAWPGAFGLYCWAVGVLDRCAVQVPLQPGSTLWCIMPVVSAVPESLRQAVMRVEAIVEDGCDMPKRLRATASCALPAGLLLSPALMLPFKNVDQLISLYGPEALAWRRLLARQHDPPPSTTRTSDRGSSAASPAAGTPTAAAAAAAGGSALVIAPDPEEEYLESMRAAGPRVLYELYIAPSEEDALHQQKVELLSALGLGCVHFLTEGLETKPLVQSALKICLADEELLSQPLVQQVMQLSQALKLFKQEQPPPGQLDVMHPTTMAATAASAFKQPVSGQEEDEAVGARGPAAAATSSGGATEVGSGASGSSSVPEGFLQLMQQAQQQLINMLESLPAEHAVAAAANKQLRQIVHDAQKHTKRRLRQMDTHEEQKSGGGGFWNAGAAQQQQQQPQLQQQQEGLELLRQGVHLYLEELVLVLGAWAQDLGLESKLDSACRRARIEPACKRLKLRHGTSV